MKIVVINGSPKGKLSNTHRIVTPFLQGAQAAGAETINIFLSEKNIKQCMGCSFCRFKHPGKCIHHDDMIEIISLCEGADIRVLASPIYNDIISSTLKIFMERMIVTTNPYAKKDSNGEYRRVKGPVAFTPKLMMISNCGFPEMSHFQIVSQWVKRVARNMTTEVIGEIYCRQGVALGAQLKILENYMGRALGAQLETLRLKIENYMNTLEKAGREIATDMCLSEETKRILAQSFLEDETYMNLYNSYFSDVLKIPLDYSIKIG